MEDSHVAAVSSVISSLQGFCRGGNPGKRQLCRREIYERVLMEEIARSDDPEYVKWRTNNEAHLQACLDECRVTGKTMVRPCNTRCLNPVVQGVWKHTNVPEFEAIVTKYAD